MTGGGVVVMEGCRGGCQRREDGKTGSTTGRPEDGTAGVAGGGRTFALEDGVLTRFVKMKFIYHTKYRTDFDATMHHIHRNYANMVVVTYSDRGRGSWVCSLGPTLDRLPFARC